MNADKMPVIRRIAAAFIYSLTFIKDFSLANFHDQPQEQGTGLARDQIG